MKVVVIGANGQLGSDVCKAFLNSNHDVVPLTHEDLEIVDPGAVELKMTAIKPDLVVNTAAMHNVEACEKDPDRSFAVNGIGARNLAQMSNNLNFVIIHISTDYVFDGAKGSPYLETDLPRPLNVYGNTKLSGEYFVHTIAERFFVLRVSGLYGRYPCRAKGGMNFVILMLKLAKERDEVRVVDDEVLTPTFTGDISSQVVKLSECSEFGIYHVTAQGSCSWYEFAKKIFELSNVPVNLSIADPREFPAKVPRPKYSVLENRALKDLGLDVMPNWVDSLQRYLNLKA